MFIRLKAKLQIGYGDPAEILVNSDHIVLVEQDPKGGSIIHLSNGGTERPLKVVETPNEVLGRIAKG